MMLLKVWGEISFFFYYTADGNVAPVHFNERLLNVCDAE